MNDREQGGHQSQTTPPTGAGNPRTDDVEPGPVPADPAAAGEAAAGTSQAVADTEPRGDHQDSEARRASSHPTTSE